MTMQDIENIVFLIPSLDPDEKMPTYVKELVEAGAKHILVVNDGSSDLAQKYFDEIMTLNGIIVLKHDVNRGKGAALKTGFKYVLENMSGIKGIVTADADGQHATDDTMNVAYRLLETNNVVFGTRNFNEEIVPFKSRNGNKITTMVFKLLYGKKVNDTQTGLRGLPIDFIPKCIELIGDRFEYEIMMLIQIVKEKRKIIEEPIRTIYFESNRATHFNTFKDSYRIYKVMFSTFLKFASSSLISSTLDIVLYTLLFNLVFKDLSARNAILFSTAVARIVSALVNFIINKTKVFKSNDNYFITMIKYTILAICQMTASWLCVYLIYSILHINTSIIKIIVDVLLFFLSYRIQQKWVFKK